MYIELNMPYTVNIPLPPPGNPVGPVKSFHTFERENSPLKLNLYMPYDSKQNSQAEIDNSNCLS